MNRAPNTPEMRALSAFFASSVNAGLDSAKMREAMTWSLGSEALAAQPGAVPSLAEIRGAVARGWCSPENERKEMDSDLALAIADEVSQLLAAAPTEAKPAQQDAVDAERWRAVRDAPAGSGIALVIPGVEGYTVHLSGDEADHIVDGVIERAAISAKKGGAV